MPTKATSNRDKPSLEVGAGQKRFQKAMIPKKKLALEDVLFVTGVELFSYAALKHDSNRRWSHTHHTKGLGFA
jgi:hypothetical protein